MSVNSENGGLLFILPWKELLVLNFALEGEQQFPSCKGHNYEENVILHWNFAKAGLEFYIWEGKAIFIF